MRTRRKQQARTRLAARFSPSRADAGTAGTAAVSTDSIQMSFAPWVPFRRIAPFSQSTHSETHRLKKYSPLASARQARVAESTNDGHGPFICWKAHTKAVPFSQRSPTAHAERTRFTRRNSISNSGNAQSSTFIRRSMVEYVSFWASSCWADALRNFPFALYSSSRATAAAF